MPLNSYACGLRPQKMHWCVVAHTQSMMSVDLKIGKRVLCSNKNCDRWSKRDNTPSLSFWVWHVPNARKNRNLTRMVRKKAGVELRMEEQVWLLREKGEANKTRGGKMNEGCRKLSWKEVKNVRTQSRNNGASIKDGNGRLLVDH